MPRADAPGTMAGVSSSAMEECIRLRDVRLLRDGAEIVANVTWTLAAGQRWALWGPNGAGKSSLLGLLEGRLAPASGTVRRAPGIRIVSVPQEPTFAGGGTVWDTAAGSGLAAVRSAEAAVRAEERRLAQGSGSLDRYAALQERFEQEGGWGAEVRLRRELATLLPGVDPGEEVARLSSGERRRLALAAALSAHADLLLLDEPTNALDLPARRWLADRLVRTPAALVIAGHDRALLGQVTTHSARLEGGRLEPVALPFDRDREARGVRRRRAEREARRATREAARLNAAADRARRWGTPAAQGAVRTLTRRAREVAREAPEATTEKARRWRLADGEDVRRGPVAWGRHLSAPGAYSDLSLTLRAGDKIALVGANGSGKSHLLRMLAGELPSARADAEVGTRRGVTMHLWDAERRGLDDTPLETQLGRWVRRARIPQLTSLVGLTPEQAARPPGELSGGERARAAVALLIAREPDLVLLDEPEADLDLPALELLEQALVDARVSVLMVTHDVRLAEAVCPEAWSLEDGALVAWRGGVHGWGRGRRRREPAVELAAPEPSQAPDPEASLMALEDEDAALGKLLEDPTRLSERDRARLAARRRTLTEARMRAYDQRLPEPAPRFVALEPPLTLSADRDGRGGLVFTADWPSLPRLQLHQGVAHLTLPDPEQACWTSWARAKALRAAAGLVFEVLAPDALQTPAVGPDAPAPFTTLPGGWWVIRLDAWERYLGLAGRDA